jgi:hypothetical protein
VDRFSAPQLKKRATALRLNKSFAFSENVTLILNSINQSVLSLLPDPNFNGKALPGSTSKSINPS